LFAWELGTTPIETMRRHLLPLLVTCLPAWPFSFGAGQGFNTQSGNATLVVVVRAANLGELPGYPRVELFLEGRRIDYGDCNTQGEYTFYFVREGVYVVRASLPGFAPAAQDVPLQSDTRQQISLELHPLGEGVAADRTDVRRRAGAKQEILAARLSRAKGDWSGAIQHMERAAVDAPHRVDIQMELGFYYWKADRLDEARTSYEKSIELDSSLLGAHLNLAQILAVKGELDEAREILRHASDGHPARSEPLYLLAKLEVDSGNLGDAEKAASLALERDHSRIPQVYLLLAGIYQSNGELGKETAALETYLIHAPTGTRLTPVHERLDELREQIAIDTFTDQYFRIVDQYRHGDYHAAVQALSHLPTDDVVRTANRMEKVGETDRVLAAMLLHTDTARLPGGADESFHIGRAVTYLGRIEDQNARRDVEHRWCLAMGNHYQSKRRFLAALPFLKQAALEFPQDIEAGLAYGSACEAAAVLLGFNHMLDRAEKQYLQVLEIAPHHAEANLRLGHVLRRMGRNDEAMFHLDNALADKASPDITLIANVVLGDIHRSKGQLSRAITCYRTAVEIEPHCQTAAVALSHGLHQARHFEESSEILKQLLRVRSDSVMNRDAWWRYLCRHSGRSDSMLSELREEVLR
jgi:tetratricopeptide (TPR) repeat protein